MYTYEIMLLFDGDMSDCLFAKDKYHTPFLVSSIFTSVSLQIKNCNTFILKKHSERLASHT